MFGNIKKYFRNLLAASFVAVALAPSVSNAGAFTDYLENKLVDYVLRGQAFTVPATVYVARSA